MQFSDLNLNKGLLNALADQGLVTPTPIQERAFSTIMAGRDVVGIAQTGTGKTLAFLLPTLRMWKFQKHRFPQILIVAPTRELVVQIVEEVEKLTTYLNVVVQGVYGGVNIRRHKAAVEEGLDIIVGTPGRIYDLLLDGVLSGKMIRHFIIDEVDELLELGFRPQLLRIMDTLPDRRQNLMFSATVTDEMRLIIEEYFDLPEVIEAARTGLPLEQIEQQVYLVPNFYTKLNFLTHLLQDRRVFQRVLVFAPSRKLADVAFEHLSETYGEELGIVHGSKSQNYRFESLRRFHAGEARILLATGLVSRGLDIQDVSHVINIDTPEQPEQYIHRIGRTGRADQSGVSITLSSPFEEELLLGIEVFMEKELDRLPMPEGIEISEQLITEEMPNLKVANVKVKLATKTPGAFHEKKKKNTKTNLTRRELQEKRKRAKQSTRRSKKRK